jgi:hypothetical protein
MGNDRIVLYLRNYSQLISNSRVSDKEAPSCITHDIDHSEDLPIFGPV